MPVFVKVFMIDVPIAHSTTVHSNNQSGSGIVVLPRRSTPSCMTRSVAKAMQTKPLPNSMKIPNFLFLGICNFHVRNRGRNMTDAVSTALQGSIDFRRLTCEVSGHIYRVCKIEAKDDSLMLIWRASASSFWELFVEVIARENARENTSNPGLWSGQRLRW